MFINHIEGANNVFADILTRWSKGYRAASAKRAATLYTDIVPSAHEVDALAVEEIINEQHKHQHPVGIEKDDDGVYKKGQKTWIPDDARSPKLRVTADAHCGERRHRAYDTNLEIVTQSYW